MLAIKHQIEAGQYHVDSWQVAEAILARGRRAESQRARGQRALAPRVRAVAQSACSNPDSFVSASANATPGRPATTEPTHVIPTLSPRHC